MQVTFYSLVMTVLWSSLLIILYSVLMRNHRFLDLFSVSGILLLHIFCMIRMFVPIEFSWVVVVGSGGIWNVLHSFLHTDIISIGEMTMDAGHILLCIWGVVSLLLLLRLVSEYYCLNQRLDKLPCKRDKIIEEILHEMDETRHLHLEAVRCSEIDEPFGAGIIRKKIVVPDHSYSRKELYFIIRHECMHHKNRDLLIQLLVNILCAFYWWNPFVYILRKNMEYQFEVRCDQMVVYGMDQSAIADYMETILKVFKAKRKKQWKYATRILGKGRDVGEDIRDRFCILLREAVPGYRTYGKLSALIMIVVVGFLSYCFVMQPSIQPGAEDMELQGQSVYEIENKDSYILHCRDGRYQLITKNGNVIELEKNMVDKMADDGFQVLDETVEEACDGSVRKNEDEK